MSDRDEVRKLAEEITQEIYGAGASLEVVNSITDGEAARTLARWESRLAQRESALQAQRDRAERDSQRLRERNLILEDEVAALQAQLHRALGEGAGLRGALERELVREDFDGFRCECGAEGVDEFDDLEHGSDCPLTASPLSERAGAVLAAVIGLLESPGENPSCVLLEGQRLRAELQKGGEREEPRSLRSASRRYEMSVHPPEGRPPRA